MKKYLKFHEDVMINMRAMDNSPTYTTPNLAEKTTSISDCFDSTTISQDSTTNTLGYMIER